MLMHTPLHCNLRYAIEKHLQIEITYKDDTEPRYVLPFCMGRSTKGNLVLRAYQVSGSSDSNTPKAWKLLLIDEIRDLKVCSKVFYPTTFVDYNVGDKGMQTIFAQVYY